MTTASQPRAARGRRAARPSGDDRELAILDTATRLLDERPLAEISVDDLAKGAGISRPTFYFYFPSKDAVLMTLLERVIAEVDVALDERCRQNPPQDRNEFWRASIALFFDTFGAHRDVARAGMRCAHRVRRGMRDMWATAMQKWIENTARVIEVERARGAAPVTVAGHDLATAAQSDE